MPVLSVTAERSAPVELHYEDIGSGRPVVLIHGWPLSGRSWEAQLPPLVEAGYRVITYDRRGFGASSQPWTGYDYDTLAADLDSLITHLDLSEATLVGFSMGGGEVARYLGRYGSARVKQAVLVSAVPPYLYQSQDNPDGGLDDATIAQFIEQATQDRPAFLAAFVENFYGAGDRTDLVSQAQKDYWRQIANLASGKATVDCIEAFARTDFRADLARIDVPTLVVHGDCDGTVPFEVSGKRSAELIPDARLHVVEGGPHGLNVSHAQELNRVLLEFLAG